MTDSTRYDHALADVFGAVASDGYDDDEDCPDGWHVSSLPDPPTCPTCGACDGGEPEWWSKY